ncbi:MAG: hypothetical protein KF718_22235 [Polyangiaceae bacterium]|nr:hypothetical protein [Polyangiaceae bacterium]
MRWLPCLGFVLSCLGCAGEEARKPNGNTGAVGGSGGAGGGASGAAGSGASAGSGGSVSDSGIGGAPADGAAGAPSYYGSYLGGAALSDQLRGAALDQHGNTYVAGGTFTSNLAGCSGAHQGNMDGVIARIDADGSLAWCRYVGGTGYDRFYDVAVNSLGTQVIVAGRASSGFPVTTGAWDATFNTAQSMCAGGGYGRQDGGVCALDAATGAIAWCTYVGYSDGCDFIRTIALDGNDDVIVGSGVVGSVQDPEYSAKFLNAPGGGQDGIVAKLAKDGGNLLWARYVGGSGDSAVEGMVAVDSLGIYYMPAWTNDPGHTIVGGFDSTYSPGASDIYLTRLSLDGATIQYATYAGGSGNEDAGMYGVMASDTPGVVYVKVGTNSADFPTSVGAVAEARNGPSDCGVIAIDTTKTGAASFVAGTYLGGSGTDFCEGAAWVTGVGLALSGSTASLDFPGVAGGRFPAHSGSGNDGWVAILSPGLTSVVYSSYLGGAGGDDSARAIDVRGQRIAVAGTSRSTTFPVSANAHQLAFSGGAEDDAIIAILPF